MIQILLLLSVPHGDMAERVQGVEHDGSCVCPVNSSVWSFPVLQFEAVLGQLGRCEDFNEKLWTTVLSSQEHLPQYQAVIQNLTARLEPHRHLSDKGLYTALSLRQLGHELSQLETDIIAVHAEQRSSKTQKLTKEVGQLRQVVDRMYISDTINMKTVKEKLRYLKNGLQSCKSIPTDFRGEHRTCLKGLIVNISSPLVAKLNPFGKGIISGSWGKQAMSDSPEERGSYWVQPLTSSNAWGNTVRFYSSHHDFMASTNHRDVAVAPSNSHSNAIEGPGTVLYGEAVYYHCYRSAEICRYDLTDKTVARVTLPGFVKDKFPYCYYDCRSYTDVDLGADETGLWAIYATVSNHGNMVVSRVAWDGQALNITHSWETRLFKRAATNAFMLCGVLYATRFADDFTEEVFYAFDTATGRESTTLALPMEKIAKGVASVNYNPTDKMIYMYNDAYLLAYQAEF